MLITEQLLEDSKHGKSYHSTKQMFMVKGLVGIGKKAEDIVNQHVTQEWWDKFMEAGRFRKRLKKNWRLGGYWRE